MSPAPRSCAVFVFFFNDTATTEIYTLSLHDALPILLLLRMRQPGAPRSVGLLGVALDYSVLGALVSSQSHVDFVDRKSTRLNSSHANISYAVFCLKKKKNRVPTEAGPTSTIPRAHAW